MGRLSEFSYSISSLYAAALLLSSEEPDDKDIPDFEVKVDWVGFEGFDFYWDIHPFEKDETSCGSVTDDILDIYRDVKRGLILYNSDDPSERKSAVWFIKFHFVAHWGEHAVNVLRVLHIARERF